MVNWSHRFTDLIFEKMKGIITFELIIPLIYNL